MKTAIIIIIFLLVSLILGVTRQVGTPAISAIVGGVCALLLYLSVFGLRKP